MIGTRRTLTTLALTLGLVASSAMSMDITYPRTKSGDARSEYPLALLELALDKAGVEYRLVGVDRPDSNSRVAVMMEQEGTYDVAFFGTRPELEEKLRVIRFPMMRGLLGHRVAITHRDLLSKLDEVDTLDEFMALDICQGKGWSDTRILENAGFNVVKGDYQNLFKVVNAKRCDAYTRAVFEAYHEVKDRAESMPALAVDDSILIRYKLASFFFVNPAKEELAQAIERGLEIAHQDGSFREFFENAPIIAKARAQLGESARHCIEIDNPLLSEETAAIADEYWGGFTFAEDGEGAQGCTLVGTIGPS